jgi:hypothetical protein
MEIFVGHEMAMAYATSKNFCDSQITQLTANLSGGLREIGGKALKDSSCL